MFKWFAGGVGLIIAIAHIGVLGHLMEEDDMMQIPLPETTEKSSYTIRATKDGYEITFIGDDPRVLIEELGADKSNGFFGIGGRSTTSRYREFIAGDPASAGGTDEEGKLTAEQIECIEAAGGGRSSGALVGGSIATGTLVPAVVNIPYIGWLAAGWMTLFGTEVGGKIGSDIATEIKGC